MNDVKKLGKKAFTWSVVALTMLWSLGGAVLLSPSAVSAATCPTLVAGNLFKVVGNSAVYLLNANLERIYFQNADLYKSWYPDYSGVHEIDSSCVVNYPAPRMAPFGANWRPGSKLVKVTIEPTVYAVLPGNVLAPIGSEAVAAALYGSNWGRKVVDVPDVFWPNYSSRAAALMVAKLHDGMIVKKASDSNVYFVKDGKRFLVDGVVAASNVTTVSDEVFASVPEGSGSVTVASIWSNPSQGSSTPSVPSTTVTGGNLMVGVAADSSPARIVADGTVFNDVLKLALTAGSASVKVSGITLSKTGLIANTQVTGVSVWDSQGNRHGDTMTSLTSDNKITASFDTDPIVVAAGSTEYLLVKVNLGTDAASNLVGFSVLAATDIKTNGTVSGNFPLVSSQLSIVDGNSALAQYTITSTAIGGITNGSETTNAGNLEIGVLQRELSKVRISETSGNEDIVVDRLVYYVEGTVQEKDLKNFKVYAPDNTVLGSAETSYDRYVTVKFTAPYTIKKSNNRDLTLKADIMDGSGRYVRMHVQNSDDVLVKGVSTGYYIAPTSFVDVKETNGWFKMKSGTLTVSKAANSPSGNVSAGSNNVVLARYEVKSGGENMEIRKMGIRIVTSTSYRLTGNVTVRDSVSGDTYLNLSSSDATLYSGAQQNLSSYINLTSGQTKILEVVGSIDSNATSSSNYTVRVGQFYAKRLSTLDFADNLGSSSIDQASNTLTVNTLSLSFTKDPAMGNRTIAAGSSQVIGQYAVHAGSAEGIKITGLSITFTGAFVAASMLQNVELWNGSTQLGLPIGTVATSSNSYNFDLLLAPNETKIITVKGLLTSSASGSFGTTVASFSYNGTGSSGTSNTDTTSAPTGQTITVGSANVIISAVTDSESISRIYTTNETPVLLGKWKVEAQNEAVKLSTISFSLRDDSLADDVDAGNFGGLYLYDASNMSTPLNVDPMTYIGGSGNGYVRFTGITLNVAAGTYKTLLLKGKINDSETMNSDSINAFVITDDSRSNLEIDSSSGSQLGVSQIDAVSANASTSTESRFATSTFYKFEDSYPTITPVSVASLEIGAITPVFKFTVKNEGSRDLRVGSVTTTISVSGMTSNGTATGTIGTWKLYEANSAGGLGTQLATSSANGLAGGAGVSGYTAANSGDVAFSSANDVNSLFDSLTVAPGSSRTFIVAADTTDLGDGKGSSSLTVNVSGKISGSTGWTGTAWNTGNFVYYYTKAGATSEVGPFTASDSYDVLGNTISRTY